MKSLKKFLTEQKYLWEQRIPTRLPSGKALMKGGVRDVTKDDPADHTLKVDLDTMKRNRPSFEHNMNVMKDTNVYKDIPKTSLEGASHDEVAEKYVEHFKSNILHLHDTMPEKAREQAKKWYDGAHGLTRDLAAKHGIPHHVASAVVAALSPQNEWNNNIALATRVLDIHHNKKEHPWSPEMDEHADRIWEKAQPKVKEALNNVRGKKYGELTHPAEKAIWIRTHDEAHNPKNHFTVTPEGKFTNKQQKTKWTSVDAIAKSINVIESGGDIQKISANMGSGHKIRNFYNNIQNPHDPTGDVTVDTHAVAAAHLRPFSSNSMEVNHAFGSNPAKKPSNWKAMKTGGTGTGINGTDPMYEEAYRRAAKERGILPRQMQSIAWEAVRAVFPANEKGKGKFNEAHKIWSDHHEGVHDASTARQKIDALTGGAGSKKYDW